MVEVGFPEAEVRFFHASSEVSTIPLAVLEEEALPPLAEELVDFDQPLGK
ncbi:MAG: hypothetical protein ACLR06_04685 [Christensenellaceae bacterium]